MPKAGDLYQKAPVKCQLYIEVSCSESHCTFPNRLSKCPLSLSGGASNIIG